MHGFKWVSIAMFATMVAACSGTSDPDPSEGGGDSTPGDSNGGDSVPDLCGNGVLDPHETCDGSLGGLTCQSLGFASGVLACGNNCQLVTAACSVHSTCGNGVRDGAELCEGANLGGATCASAGFDRGTIACTAQCTFDTSGCQRCGDGVRDGDEVCDGADFGGADCTSELGAIYLGTLTCNSCSVITTENCTLCGNGALDTGEACDGTVSAGTSCADLGATNATPLSCTTGCNFDSAGCTFSNAVCMPACNHDGGCLMGLCNLGVCDFSCNVDSDCDNPIIPMSFYCHPDTGRCGVCANDLHCDAGEQCVAGVCELIACAVDTDCIAGRCDVASGKCIECDSDADCTEPMIGTSCHQAGTINSFCGCVEGQPCDGLLPGICTGGHCLCTSDVQCVDGISESLCRPATGIAFP